ncbi:hypothetical protein IFM89_008759 [Coptis chinensis]|uniref:Wound-responsive family protein n=1 Tax=Coptis chinensis TaxID=261450 RepID=A0A835GVB8_9MAGN|nr:hypothetical protein IFM89_003405 [Coptis chinensis]KAF9588329.1 hypothetical protein IFM89_008759 [Coptis chinensis]
MSSTSRAWVAALCVGAIEALKDQGLYRWNYAFRSLQDTAKNNIRSFSQAKRLSPTCSSMKSFGLLFVSSLFLFAACSLRQIQCAEKSCDLVRLGSFRHVTSLKGSESRLNFASTRIATHFQFEAGNRV